jgi:hypothetical protein
MEPWVQDAGNITISDQTKQYLLTNAQIERFLNVGNHEKKFFLIGAKGLGKTLFLKYKRYLYQNSDNFGSYQFHPSNEELCENLLIDHANISKEDVLKFRETNLWERIWIFCFSLIACKASQQKDIKIPQELEDMFPSFTASTILSILLQKRASINQILADYNILLISRVKEIKSGVLIFIDNFDQELELLLKQPHLTDYQMDNDFPSSRVWVNSQFGLMSAIYRLNKANPHVKVFTSIRSEAFENSQNETKANLMEYSTFLEYTKDEVRKIFDKNIALMDEKDLFGNKEETKLITRFLGFENMPHPFAKSNGKRINEEPFDFIYRHTFGRPREVIRIGKEINYFIRNASDYENDVEKIEKIRKRVNLISNDLFKQYTNEIIPAFNETDFSNFIGSIKKNVFTLDPNKKDETTHDSLDEEIVKLYFNLGLIGYIREKSIKDKALVQLFLPPGKYSYKKLDDLPASPYFLTHPSMDEDLRKKWGGDFYSTANIIGVDYPFNPAIDLKNQSYNILHFGAGRFGMGLVIPLLNSLETNLAIISRPDSEFWSEAKNKFGIGKPLEIIRENGLGSYEIAIFDDEYLKQPNSCEKVIKIWHEGKTVLLLTDDDAVIKKFINSCFFITTAVTAEGLRDYLSRKLQVIDSDEPKPIFPFENNRNEINKLKKVLVKTNYAVNFVTADKICSQRDISEEGVMVNCEDYEKVWIHANDYEISNLFDKSAVITTRASEFEEDIDNARKSYLVDGIHTILAIYAVAEFLREGTNKLNDVPFIHHLCKDEKIKENLKTFCTLQAIRIVIEKDDKHLYSYFNTGDINEIFQKILNFGDETIERFARTPDTAARILGFEKNIIKSFRQILKTKLERHINPLTNIIIAPETENTVLTLGLITKSEFSSLKDRLLDLDDKLIQILTSSNY